MLSKGIIITTLSVAKVIVNSLSLTYLYLSDYVKSIPNILKRDPFWPIFGLCLYILSAKHGDKSFFSQYVCIFISYNLIIIWEIKIHHSSECSFEQVQLPKRRTLDFLKPFIDTNSILMYIETHREQNRSEQ